MENGKIYVFSRKEGSGEGAYKYNGWPLLDSYYFGFTDKNNADGPQYHYSTGGSVQTETRIDQTYKFFFKAKPKVGANDPDAWPQGGVIQTLYGEERIQINADWNNSKWEKKTINSATYYVFTLTTKEIDWNWRFNWRYNDNGVTTYSAVGGPTNGTVQNYSLFSKDSNWGNALCVTIDELHKAKAGSPGAEG